MKKKIINPDKLSLVPINIEMLYSETNNIIATGTAFIYEFDSTSYIITNWHNLTGINPITKEYLSPRGLQPDKINLYFFKKETEEKKDKTEWIKMTLNIYDDKLLTEPIWLVHPEFKEQIDVVAISIDLPDEIKCYPINMTKYDDIEPIVSDEVFIIGFPYNLKGGGYLPIWKKGSIATEPDIDYNNLPLMLIDTASREGMSGSPVIYRRSGIHNLKNGKFANDSFSDFVILIFAAPQM